MSDDSPAAEVTVDVSALEPPEPLFPRERVHRGRRERARQPTECNEREQTSELRYFVECGERGRDAHGQHRESRPRAI